MPPPATVDELIDLAIKAGAADEPALNHFYSRRDNGETQTPESAVTAMVRDGLLTPYQAQRLLRGETVGLRIADRYRILERIGVGGMGQVFLCEDTNVRRAVAVKMLPAAASTDSGAVARFRREQRATAVLDHPGIVRALDVGQDGRCPFLVLEFVDGADLYRYVATRGPLAPRAAAHYVARAADALQRAIDQGWIHRDVKPHNLMVDRAGRLRLLDFGLARPHADDSRHPPVSELVGVRSLLGTADFIAPEQSADSSRVDGRADVYALGATFYFLLTSRPPFPEGTMSQKLAWHRTREPNPVRQTSPDVPEAMACVLAKMMAKDPAARFQSTAEIAVALAGWADPPPPPPDPQGLPDWPPAIRRLLGLPTKSGNQIPVSVPPPLPSSFPKRSRHKAGPATRELPGWVAVGAVIVGLITALLLAIRSPSQGIASEESASPPTAGASVPASP
jgi:eukaryotic-like serine/threonine-protein kinase